LNPLSRDADCGVCGDFSLKITPGSLTLLKKDRAFSIAADPVPLS
jgi:hypothetical protein